MPHLLWPARIRCFACDRVGRARVNWLYRFFFLVFLLLAAATFKFSLGFLGLGVTHSLDWIVFAGPAIYIFFSKKAHRCASCGSEFWSRPPRG